MKSMPKFSIGKDKRSKEELKNSPAPDSYSVKDSFTKTQSAAWGFGSSKRKGLNSSTLEVPAPGNYDINSRAVEGPKYCLGMRTLNSLEM
jgi:Sperm-tail PG-rich repeat